MRNGFRRMMTNALAIAATLVLAGAAAGQSGTRMRSESVHDGHRVSVTTTGEVRFTDDDRGLSYVEPGARMVIEEEGPGQPDRRVEYRSAGGGVQRTFFRDGREVRPDSDNEAWIRGALLRAIRESGANAPERTARIYRRGGVDAVLDEIREIGSDGSKTRYYTALLRLPLRAGETARVLRDAGNRIGSDGDKARTLAVLLERRSISADEMVAMLDAAARIGSDGDKSRLLIAALARDPLESPAAREAFFRTAAGIGSDGDKSRVLIQAVAREPLRRETVVEAVRTARSIGSDGDKTRVLIAVPSPYLREHSVLDAYRETLRTIGSDGDRSRAAARLAGSLR